MEVHIMVSQPGACGIFTSFFGMVSGHGSKA